MTTPPPKGKAAPPASAPRPPTALGSVDYQALLRDGARNVGAQDVAAVARHARAIKSRSGALAGSHPRLAARVRLLADLVLDYSRKRYRKVSIRVVRAATYALLYFLSPDDVVPDPIPLVGFGDDEAILGLVFYFAEEDLRDYSSWKGVPFPE